MFCPKCGAPVTDGAQFCTSCGTPLHPKQAPAFSPAPPVGAAPVCPVPQGAPAMGWYRFLSGFGLIADAAFCLLNGGGTLVLTLLDSQISSGSVSSVLLSVLTGLVLCGVGAYALYTRTRLKSFCKNAPTHLTVLLSLNAALLILIFAGISFILTILFGFAGTGAMAVAGIVSGLVCLSLLTGLIVLIVLNRSYFKKRSFLFINK